MNVDRLKNEMIEDLKSDVLNFLTEDFVEKSDTWKHKMTLINLMLHLANPQISKYSYDEFCKKTLDVTKVVLENTIDYEKLFLTPDEYSEISKKSEENKNDIQDRIIERMDEKFFKNLMLVVDKENLKGLVSYKLGDDFKKIENNFEFFINSSISKNQKKS